VFNFFP